MVHELNTMVGVDALNALLTLGAIGNYSERSTSKRDVLTTENI